MSEWFSPPLSGAVMVGEYGDWTPARILCKLDGKYLVSFGGNGTWYPRYVPDHRVRLDLGPAPDSGIAVSVPLLPTPSDEKREQVGYPVDAA